MKNKQITLAGSGFENYAKTTRRAQFLADMERVVPWAEASVLCFPWDTSLISQMSNVPLATVSRSSPALPP